VQFEQLMYDLDPISPLELHYRSFLLDREARRCTAKTLSFYDYCLSSFIGWLKEQGVKTLEEITAQHIRQYLVSLDRRGLKGSTCHAHARSVRAWLNWLVAEGDLDKSPMERVRMPKVEQRIQPPFCPDDIKRLLKACQGRSPLARRDRAIVLSLLDTGLRASEFVGLKVGSIDMETGLVIVYGKGGKQRQVRFGAKTRQAILRYLASRDKPTPDSPLWATFYEDHGERGALTYWGLRQVLRRLGERAKVKCHPHRFRRTFALWCLRDGMDLHSLRLLMGHSDLQVLQRYLALAGEDVERAHRLHSPVDNLL
jgi:integrase/recombinase XerC